MGDDALSVFYRAAELISLTRKTSQPSFLEVPVYRWVEHCGPDEDDNLVTGRRLKSTLGGPAMP